MFTRILKRGTRGPDVKAWQYFLIGQGVLAGTADSVFGPNTESATRRWQLTHRLHNDGVVGNDTLAIAIQNGFAVVPDVADDMLPLCPKGFRPLANNAARAARFGTFEFRSLNNKAGEIQILGNWEDRNIVTVDCPVFHRKVRLHQAVAADYLGFMTDIIAADLDGLLYTFDGAFYPRYIRGSKTSLSNHSWGTAFDVNYEWNKLGAVPARIGVKGSVREIVMIGVKWGWYWGGWFTRRDGMHFEHV